MYRTLDSGIYADPRWRSLPAAGRWLYVYLCTNPHSHISGLYYLPQMFMMHETGLSPEAVETSLTRLCTVELCAYDEAGEVVWILDLLRWQG